MPKIRINGPELYYEDVGSGKETLVFSHGLLFSTRLFDPLAVALVGIGEETGQLDEMLLTVARYFEADVEAAIATLAAAVEPAMIGVLGTIVGFIVFSVFLPLYSLIGSVSR